MLVSGHTKRLHGGLARCFLRLSMRRRTLASFISSCSTLRCLRLRGFGSSAPSDLRLVSTRYPWVSILSSGTVDIVSGSARGIISTQCKCDTGILD